METNKLLHFTTVFDTQNLRQAAELLNMSHSALSKSIKTLEMELGYELFLPDGRGIISSQKAELLYIKAKKILDSINELKDLEPTFSKKRFKITSFEVFTTYFLQLLTEEFKEYEIELHENLDGHLEEAVASGIVDVGITYEPIPTKGLEFLKISKIKMSAYIGVKSKFQNLALSEIPFAVPRKPIKAAPSGNQGLDGWPEHLFPRIVKYQVDMMESAIELTRQGNCAVFLPEFVVKLHNQIAQSEYRLIKVDSTLGMKSVFRDVFLVKRRNSPESKELKKLAKILRRI